MIKMLEDLLIEASTNPNVPGSLVAGLRKAVDAAREAMPSQTCAPPQVAADPPYRVCVKAHETNVGNTVPVGHVATLEVGELLQKPDCWAPCDKDGWVTPGGPIFTLPEGLQVEWGHANAWRPLHQGTGVIDRLKTMITPAAADGPPKPSAIDEMAEQMKRWAAPTRSRDPAPQGCRYDTLWERIIANTGPFRYETTMASGGAPSPVIDPVIAWFDKDGKIQGRVSDEQLYLLCENAQVALEERNAWDEQYKAQEAARFESVKDAPALAVQEGGSHYKDMKIQPVEYIHTNGLGYFEGNVVKYVSRWRAKGGLQDLKKARHYLDLLIELEGDTK